MKLDKKICKAKKKMRKQFKKNKALGVLPRLKKEREDLPDSFPNKNEFLKSLIAFKKEQKEANDKRSIQNSNAAKVETAMQQ